MSGRRRDVTTGPAAAAQGSPGRRRCRGQNRGSCGSSRCSGPSASERCRADARGSVGQRRHGGAPPRLQRRCQRQGCRRRGSASAPTAAAAAAVCAPWRRWCSHRRARHAALGWRRLQTGYAGPGGAKTSQQGRRRWRARRVHGDGDDRGSPRGGRRLVRWHAARRWIAVRPGGAGHRCSGRVLARTAHPGRRRRVALGQLGKGVLVPKAEPRSRPSNHVHRGAGSAPRCHWRGRRSPVHGFNAYAESVSMLRVLHDALRELHLQQPIVASKTLHLRLEVFLPVIPLLLLERGGHPVKAGLGTAGRRRRYGLQTAWASGATSDRRRSCRGRRDRNGRRRARRRNGMRGRRWRHAAGPWRRLCRHSAVVTTVTATVAAVPAAATAAISTRMGQLLAHKAKELSAQVLSVHVRDAGYERGQGFRHFAAG